MSYIMLTDDEFLKKVYKDFEELYDDEILNAKEMWVVFIKGLSKRYKIINSELDKENPNTKIICTAFHQIKTTCAYFSLEEEYDIASDFEFQVKSGDIDFDNDKKNLLFQTIERLIGHSKGADTYVI